MDLQEFNRLKTGPKYAAINRATIRALRDLGGQASFKEIINRIRDYDPEISQEIVDHKKISKKTGNSYSEFIIKFRFNMSTRVKNGTIIRVAPNTYQLSKNGLKLDPNKPHFEEKQDELEKSNKKDKKENITEAISSNSDIVDDEKEPSWRTELRKDLLLLDPHKFELLCRKLLSKMNVDIDEDIGMSYTNDGGVDGFGYLVSDELRTERVAIQAKRWNGDHLVSSPEIDKFRGAMDKYNAEYGVFITTSNYTRGARKNSHSGTRMITLINGEKLLDLIVKYNVYVHPSIEIEDFYKE